MKARILLLVIAWVLFILSANAESVSRDDMSYEFQFGDLSIWITLGEGEWRLCETEKIKPVQGKKVCSEFSVGDKKFFIGTYSATPKSSATRGLFEYGNKPKLILESRYFKRFRVDGNNYILNTQQGVHVTYSVLYKILLENGKTSLKKIHSTPHSFRTIHKLPKGIIYIGYNFKNWVPWAVFFDGEHVYPLQYLGEPEELVPRDGSDVKEDNPKRKVHY